MVQETDMTVSERGANSLKHTRYLVEVIGSRGSTTAAEKEAARYVQQALEQVGLPVTVQPFRSPTSAWRPFAVVMGMAVMATVLAPLANPVTGVVAALLCLSAVWLLFRELRLKETPLRSILPQGNSQNVFARLAPSGTSRQRVVLVGHLDSHRTPYFHQTRERQAFLDRLLMVSFAGFFINAIIFLLAAFVDLPWLYGIAIPFTLLHLLGVFIVLQVDRTPFSPGANDNAVSVATLLTLAKELVPHPLRQTELWFLFSGCEEVGCYGMRAFLEKYRQELEGALFIDYEMVGQGEPGIVMAEGIMGKIDYDAELIDVAAAAAEAVWRPAHRKISLAYGESVVSQGAGYRSVTLNAVIPATGQPVAWHRPDDDMSVVDEKTLGHVAAWGLEILHRIDAGL